MTIIRHGVEDRMTAAKDQVRLFPVFPFIAIYTLYSQYTDNSKGGLSSLESLQTAFTSTAPLFQKIILQIFPQIYDRNL